MTTRATAKKGTRPATTTTDAIKLLTVDHKEVHALFQNYKQLAGKVAGSDERQALAEQICMLLTLHAAIEEEILYPAAREAEVDSYLLDAAEVEHASATVLMTQIRGMAPGDDLYDAKVAVLGEYIDHHVKEEHDEIFPKCRESSMDLNAIGALLAARTRELMAEMSEGQEAVQ